MRHHGDAAALIAAGSESTVELVECHGSFCKLYMLPGELVCRAYQSLRLSGTASHTWSNA
jgi:hypothetical protein